MLSEKLLLCLSNRLVYASWYSPGGSSGHRGSYAVERARLWERHQGRTTDDNASHADGTAAGLWSPRTLYLIPNLARWLLHHTYSRYNFVYHEHWTNMAMFRLYEFKRSLDLGLQRSSGLDLTRLVRVAFRWTEEKMPIDQRLRRTRTVTTSSDEFCRLMLQWSASVPWWWFTRYPNKRKMANASERGQNRLVQELASNRIAAEMAKEICFWTVNTSVIEKSYADTDGTSSLSLVKSQIIIRFILYKKKKKNMIHNLVIGVLL